MTLEFVHTTICGIKQGGRLFSYFLTGVALAGTFGEQGSQQGGRQHWSKTQIVQTFMSNEVHAVLFIESLS